MLELAIMCGLPRGGKTTTAHRLEARGFVRVCPDDIRLAIHGQQFISRAEPLVWATADTMVRALLIGGRSVVVDATNTTRGQRAHWAAFAREFYLALDIYLVETPTQVCLERNHDFLDNSIIMRMAQQYQRPTHDEGRLLTFVSGVGSLVTRCACDTCDERWMFNKWIAMQARLPLDAHKD